MAQDFDTVWQLQHNLNGTFPQCICKRSDISNNIFWVICEERYSDMKTINAGVQPNTDDLPKSKETKLATLGVVPRF